MHLSSPSNSGVDQAAPQKDPAASGSSIAMCPLCGRSGPKKWLEARDRFHGRPERYLLVRCSGCSLVWLSNAPPPEEMHRHYTDSYHRLISRAGETSPHRWEAHGKKLTSTSRVVPSLIWAVAREHSWSSRGKSWERYGIEMSAECARTEPRHRTGAHVFVGDITGSTFPLLNPFDVITCFDVLEHLYEPRRVLAKVPRMAEARRNLSTFRCPT